MLNIIRETMGYLIVLPMFMAVALFVSVLALMVFLVLKTLDVLGLAGSDEKRALDRLVEIAKEQFSVFSK